MSEELLISRDDGVWRLTLNRPAVGNALSASLVEAVHAALDAFEAANGRVLVLEGQGASFCTGFDLQGLEETSDADLFLRFVRIEQLLARVWSAPFATIAAAQGRAIGAGADLFAACQRRIAVEGASFRFPGAGFGLVLGSRRLAARLGESEALRIIAQARTLGCEEAVRLGLSTVCLPADKLTEGLEAEIATALRLDAATFAAVRAAQAEGPAGLQADMASLVASASRPGLRERILAYRSRASSNSAVRSVHTCPTLQSAQGQACP